jgi:hypothetical protein
MTPDPLSPVAVDNKLLSKKMRVGLWLIAWVLAAAAIIGSALPVLIFGWLFPLGLAAPFGASHWTSAVPTYAILFVGWSGYIALSVYGLKQAQRVRHFRTYAIQISILILNVSGCLYELTHMHFGC